MSDWEIMILIMVCVVGIAGIAIMMVIIEDAKAWLRKKKENTKSKPDTD